jgi:outer membrane protein OmpA-like peptidoglycan-associated protein
VPPARLYAVGRGEDEPVASNLSATGRAQNRRVEIVIRPNA